jgi:hypothetical protein
MSLTFEPYLLSYEKNEELVNSIRQYSNTKLQSIKKIVNVYQPYYKNNTRAAGLGDFIRGSYFLYQYCKIANKEFDINFNYHPIGKILDKEYDTIDQHYLLNIEKPHIFNYYSQNNYERFTNTRLYEVTIHEVNEYLSKCLVDENGILYVYLLPFPIFRISNNDRVYIKKHLQYNQSLQKDISFYLEKFNLIQKEFNVIHIRMGDDYLVNNVENINYTTINNIDINIKLFINKNSSTKYVLLSDSKLTSRLFCERNPELIYFNNDACHLGEKANISYDEMKSNIIEFYIMSKSSSILSISTYEWGSGFSKWCAETWEIPYMSICCR